MMKFEDFVVVKVEFELFDFFDIDEFFNNGNQEVLFLFIVMDFDFFCFFDYDLFLLDYEIQESDYLVLVDLFVFYFKGKVVYL